MMKLLQLDDIKRHGPPMAYTEDAFEKNHGAIRYQISHENQHARSRDTASKMAKHYICQHIITGGYYKDKSVW